MQADRESGPPNAPLQQLRQARPRHMRRPCHLQRAPSRVRRSPRGSVAATEATAEAAVVVAVEAEAPPTYGISASVTYIVGLRAMAAALVGALEGRQSGENEGREEEGVNASAAATGGSSQGARSPGLERPSSKDRRTSGGAAAGEARSGLRSSFGASSLGGGDDAAAAAGPFAATAVPGTGLWLLLRASGDAAPPPTNSSSCVWRRSAASNKLLQLLLLLHLWGVSTPVVAVSARRAKAFDSSPGKELLRRAGRRWQLVGRHREGSRGGGLETHQGAAASAESCCWLHQSW